MKKLLLGLVNATSEKEVTSIIQKSSLLKNDDNWKPYGGFRGNFSQIHNQAKETVPSLIEKPINSIDAILTKECKLRGIDPESADAPESIQDAVDVFFNIKDGDFSELVSKERRELAENIQIIAEALKNNPNIIIYDNGEGQLPIDFENTFLSLNKDNKLKIKFVQGKYNQGGTGVLPNCGEMKYQLILSRKNKNLLNGNEDLYGFTLVRMHLVETIGALKNSWYEYCVGTNGNILNFPATEDLDLGLHNRLLSFGTYIKLFEYDLPDSSDITLGLWRDMNRYLYYPGLPILLYEKREYKGHSKTKVMLGNRMRIMIDDREMKELTFPMSINFNGVNFPTEVTVFKDSVDKKEFIDKQAVIFTLNGQVHDYLDNSFIKYRAKLAYLSGQILVNVDCSNIPTNIREELLMSSRDRMRDNAIARKLKEEIADELRDNTTLRKLDEKRRDEKIFNNPKDEDFLNKVMGKLIHNNEEISKILGLHGSIIGKTIDDLKKRVSGEDVLPKLKRFPTSLNLKNLSKGNIKMCPQNGECKIYLETDSEDEFLIRPKDKGELKIHFETPHFGSTNIKIIKRGRSDAEIFDVNIVGPNQGQIKLRIKPKDLLPIGTIVPLNIDLSSKDGSLKTTAFIKIDNPINKKNQRNEKQQKTYSLPKLIEVYREKKQDIEPILWENPDYNWTGEDICKIFPSSDVNSLVDAVAVNMDATVLHNYMRSRKLSGKNVEKV